MVHNGITIPHPAHHLRGPGPIIIIEWRQAATRYWRSTAMNMWDYDRWGGMLSVRPKTIKINVGGGATAIRAQAGASRSAHDDERAEVAPTTDEASAES